MWITFKLYGLGDRLSKKMKKGFVNRTCLEWGNSMNAWLPVQVGLWQGCGISFWLFNKVSIDGVVMQVNVRMLGRGLSLVNTHD